MRQLTELAHDFCRTVLEPGAIAIDATAGNGHDTLFLARQVGPTGTVFAFDRQIEAITSTTDRLQQAGVSHVVLQHADHAEMAQRVPIEHHGCVSAVMFNLGYLPGGNKSIITQRQSTLPAIQQSLRLLRSGGVLTVLCYQGHPGGREETASVTSFFESISAESWSVEMHTARTSTDAPLLFDIRKK